MNKHTPGPWRVGDAGHAVFGAPGSGLYPNAPICVVKGIANKANAALIAAAPEMFEALKKIAQGDGAYGYQAVEYKEIARAALAKIGAHQ